MSETRYLLTSTSQVKKSVVEELLQNSPITLDCKGIPSNEISGNVEQPVGIGGLICCKNRIKAALRDPEVSKKYYAIISIENAITAIKIGNTTICCDVVHIMMYNTRERMYTYETGGHVYFDMKYWNHAVSKSEHVTPIGWSYTVGESMKDLGAASDHKNWMKDVACLERKSCVDRHDQVFLVLRQCYERFGYGALRDSDIMAHLEYDTNFKKGVVFKDIGSLMAHPVMLKYFYDACLKTLEFAEIPKIDYVVSIGARGFYIGPVLADRMECAHVPIRKTGKLPGVVMTNSYGTEYSKDSMDIQPDLFANREREQTVLIVDDLVATGGSLASACELIEAINATGKNIKVVACFCPFKVDGLINEAARKISKFDGVRLITL